MTKRFLAFAIATLIFVFCFIGCSNNSSPVETTTATETTVIYTAAPTTTFYDTFDNTDFVSEEAERVFTVIREEKQYTDEGFSVITDYLRSNPSEEVIDDFHNSESHWTLGENCTLVVNSTRSLELKNSEGNVQVLVNVDTLMADKKPDFLNDDSYGRNGYQNSWLVGDMTFVDGNFYHLGEIIFDATAPIDSQYKVVLIGNSTSSDGINYIVAKHNNKIVLIKEKLHEFTHEVIADDAVSEPNILSFPRTDCYMSITNHDAVMYCRSLYYRTENNKLVQLDITDNGVKSFILVDDFREYNLLYDYSGVYWLRTTDLAEKSLEELLYLSKYPKHFISRDGDIMEYSPSGN